MSPKKSLEVWDYAVISLTMMVSVGIGIYFRFTGTRQKTAREFLMAGRSMKQFPAIFSLVVTKLSAIAIIGEPSDIYMYGTQRCLAFIFLFIGSIVTAFLYLPVYFNTGASTIYEFLERRFGKRTRKLISVFSYVQTLLNMSIVIYTPAIAMSAVSTLDIDTTIFLTAGVCILFSAMGGLKAVMWADVFQAAIMYGCLFTVLIVATTEVGGLAELYKAAYDSGRMNFFNFHSDPSIPYTFWNSLSYGVQFGISLAVNQMEVQRLLAVKSLENAQSAVLWTSIPSFVMAILTTSTGLAMYAVFKNCDPLSKESGIGLSKADQIVPYYIISRLTAYPGLPGLCISGILCASISSLSSAINSLSTIFVEDFMKMFKNCNKVAQTKLSLIAKLLVVFHGIVIVGLSYFTSLFKSVLQGVVVLDGIILGPTLGVFTLGILTETTDEMGSLIGLASGAFISGWIGLGSSFFGTTYEGKPMGTNQCNLTMNFTTYDFYNKTVLYGALNGTDAEGYIFPLYRISYMWTYCIGAACTIFVGFVSSLILNFGEERDAIDPKLLSPVTRFWVKPIPEDSNIPLKNQKR